MTVQEEARRRVQRKRAARRAVAAWLNYTPMELVGPTTVCADGDVIVTVAVRVRKSDVDAWALSAAVAMQATGEK